MPNIGSAFAALDVLALSMTIRSFQIERNSAHKTQTLDFRAATRCRRICGDPCQTGRAACTGTGDNGGPISSTALADLTERETNKKYYGRFMVHALNETQVGERVESILSERTDSHGEQDLFFHAAAFKVADYFRIQDDYELQKLVRPIVEEVMGGDAELIYDLTYASPDLFSHIDRIDMDWNKLLQNREREQIQVDLSFYASFVPKYDLADKLRELEDRLKQEHLRVAGLRMYRVDRNDLDHRLLTMDRDGLGKVIREVSELATDGEDDKWDLKSGPFAGFD